MHKHLQQVTNAGKNMSLSSKWALVFKELKDKYDKISTEKGKNVGGKRTGEKKTECILRSRSSNSSWKEVQNKIDTMLTRHQQMRRRQRRITSNREVKRGCNREILLSAENNKKKFNLLFLSLK